MDVGTLAVTWAAQSPTPLDLASIGDATGDGVGDYQLGDWLVAGPAVTPRSLPADAAAALTRPAGVMTSFVGDVDGDGLVDLQVSDIDAADASAEYRPSLLLGPFAGDVLARGADAAQPFALGGGQLAPGGGAGMDAIVEVDDGTVTLIPGPLSNFAVGAGSTTITSHVVNTTPYSDVCAVLFAPWIRALGDLDGDGEEDRMIVPYDWMSPQCPWQVGYVLPSSLPATVEIAQEGITGWAVVPHDLRLLGDQTGDGVDDGMVDIDGSWHLVGGPFDTSSGTVAWASDLGVLPPEYQAGTTIPDVTGDGMDDWIVGSWRDAQVTDVWLRPGGAAEIFAASHTHLGWWAGAQLNRLVVDRDVLLFSTVDGVVALDLAP